MKKKINVFLIKGRGIADTDVKSCLHCAGDANSCFYLLNHHLNTCRVFFFNKQYNCRVKFTVIFSPKITIIFSVISNYVENFFKRGTKHFNDYMFVKIYNIL